MEKTFKIKVHVRIEDKKIDRTSADTKFSVEAKEEAEKRKDPMRQG